MRKCWEMRYRRGRGWILRLCNASWVELWVAKIVYFPHCTLLRGESGSHEGRGRSRRLQRAASSEKMPRSGAGRTSKPRCATMRSFSHAECRSLTHGVAGVAAIPSKACWRGVEVKCCDGLGRHPCCSLGMLRLNFEAPAWPLADALRGLPDGKWPRWASAHICRYRCALSRWDKTNARSRMLAVERGTVLLRAHGQQRWQRVIGRGRGHSSRSFQYRRALGKPMHHRVRTAPAPCKGCRRSASPKGPNAPTTDTVLTVVASFARFTGGRCALRFFPGSSPAAAANAIYLACRTFLYFFTEEALLTRYLR
jgi:hypothetical protein